MTELFRHERAPEHTPDRAPAASRAALSENAADVAPIAVIAACFVPIGLVVIAVHGGGIPAAAIAFAAVVALTALLVRLLGRAVDRDNDGEER